LNDVDPRAWLTDVLARIAEHQVYRDRRTPAVALAIPSYPSRSIGLTLPAISHVLTINYVAEMLGEDVEWLHELQITMFPENGCRRVSGIGQDGVPAFTDYGIECLRQIIADERAAGPTP
jgi:hypothetical protein